ncbi:MAG TPA: four helix bundle protein [Gemmatimonadaceae bacterium]
MQNPKALIVWQRSLDLALAVYRLTGQFPSHEQFGLTAQMRRAAVSVGSNIVEGCGRWGSRELLQFLQIAYSSAAELAFQLTIATELQYGNAVEREATVELVDHVQRMLNRLMVTKRAALTDRRPGRASSRKPRHG